MRYQLLVLNLVDLGGLPNNGQESNSQINNNANTDDGSRVGEAPNDSDYYTPLLRVAMGEEGHEGLGIMYLKLIVMYSSVYVCGNVNYLIVCIGLDWIAFKMMLDCVRFYDK